MSPEQEEINVDLKIEETDDHYTCALGKQIYKICAFRGQCVCTHAQLAQSCPILCDSIDCNTPGSSFHWILQGKNTGVGRMKQSDYVYNVQSFMKTHSTPLSGLFDVDSFAEFSLLLVELFLSPFLSGPQMSSITSS